MTINDKIKNRRLELNLTLEEVAKAVGVAKSTVKKWESGQIASMRQSKIEALAKILQVSPIFLIFEDDKTSKPIPFGTVKNISPIATQRVPMLGNVACGKPIFTNEDRESYVQAGTDIKADFCLTAHGDSMINARINNGDLIFCRAQNMVENGEIGVVIIGDEATLKRVYYYPQSKKLVLQAENPKYEPLVYLNEELDDIHIIGKAIAFQSDIE